MADDTSKPDSGKPDSGKPDADTEASGKADPFGEMMRQQSEAAAEMFGVFARATDPDSAEAGDAAHWTGVAQRLQTMWLEFQTRHLPGPDAQAGLTAPAHWAGTWMEQATAWYDRQSLADPALQKSMWADGMALWETALSQFGIGPKAFSDGTAQAEWPRKDRRFAEPQWREQPVYALIHQSYLMVAEQITAMVDSIGGLGPENHEQLRFAARALVDTLSPSNFPATNPLVIERAIATRGDSLIKGMEHLLGDLSRGQLTHTDPEAFKVGENIAVTPGKVVFETPLYQLIQYTPVTAKVLTTPLVIFPPWINRFYILDLNPKKSFVRWAVEQGVSVFVVSWKSADASMADIVWDDYIAAQIEAIDHVRTRLEVPAVHAIGYGVAGTTLAATLAILARKGEAGKVCSATFFTAQVDFEQAGDLKIFVTDDQIETISQISPEGYLDGRYMAATFNLLRGNDLIWSYVVNNYLLGQEYSAFDLLHWNGDVTNLPVKWHQSYLRDLYRDNRLVVPDSLSACGVPIDLGLVETPSFIQAGREDHISPPESVWELTRQFGGPCTFLLAGSGHIAGVVNPPSAGKYQYWTNDAPAETLAEFVAGAQEIPGSWWPHWAVWLRAQDPAEVAATGKRKPGGRGDKAIEDAPGRYVKLR